jgi:hypothetical protein
MDLTHRGPPLPRDLAGVPNGGPSNLQKAEVTSMYEWPTTRSADERLVGSWKKVMDVLKLEGAAAQIFRAFSRQSIVAYVSNGLLLRQQQTSANL